MIFSLSAGIKPANSRGGLTGELNIEQGLFSGSSKARYNESLTTIILKVLKRRDLR